MVSNVAVDSLERCRQLWGKLKREFVVIITGFRSANITWYKTQVELAASKDSNTL